jgi:hypothetical protein
MDLMEVGDESSLVSCDDFSDYIDAGERAQQQQS